MTPGPYYGRVICAPAFKNIAFQLMRYMEIPLKARSPSKKELLRQRHQERHMNLEKTFLVTSPLEKSAVAVDKPIRGITIDSVR